MIYAQYALGIQRVQRYGNSLEFKLLGNPWGDGISGHDGIHGRSLICHLVHVLANHHWKLVTSADVSAKYVHRDKAPDYPIDVAAYSSLLTQQLYSHQHQHHRTFRGILNHLHSLLLHMAFFSKMLLHLMTHQPMVHSFLKFLKGSEANMEHLSSCRCV